MAEKMDFVENHSQDSDEDEQYSNENEHSLYSEEREDIDSDERGVSEISSHELTADMEEKRSGDEAIFEKHQSQDSYDNKHFFCNEESIDIDSDENDEIDVAEIPFYELRAGSGDKGCEDKADTEKCGDHDPTDLGRITNNFPQGDSAESENPPFKYYAAIDVVSPPKFVSQEDVSASSNVEIHAPAMTREIDKVKGSAKRKPKRKSQQNTDDLEAPRKSAIVSLIRRKENFSPSLTYTREKRSDVKQRHKHLRKANDKQAKSRKGRAIRVTVDSGKKARAGRNSKMNSDLVEESNNIKRTRSQWRIERRRSGRVRNKPQEGSYKVENTPKASDQSLVKHGRNKSQVRSYKRENKPTPLNQPLRKVGRPRKMSGGKGNKQRRIRFKIRKYDKIIEDSPGIKRHSTAVAAKTDDSDNNGDIEVDSGMETSPFSTTNSRPKLLRNEQSPPFELLYRYPVISSESNRREFRSTVASSAGAYSLQRNEMRNTKQETRINNENLESNVKGLLTADDDFSSDHTYVKVSKFSDQKSDHTSTLRGTKQKSSSTCSLKCVECSSIGKQATEILLKMKEHINRHKVKDSFHCEGCNVDFEDTLNFQNHVLLQVMTNSRSATEQVKSQKNVATKVTATLGNARNESRYQPLQAVEEIKSNFISDASESNEATSGQRETIRGNELNKDERRKLQPIEASNLTVSSEFLPELEVSKVQESGSNRKNRKRPQRPSSVETFTRKSTRRSSAQTNASSQSSIPSSLDASSVTGKNTGQHNVTSEKSLTKELPVVETEVVIGPVQIESSTVDADCPDVHNMTQSNVKNENASQSLKIVKIRTRASTKNLNSKSTKKASFTNQIDSNVHSAVGLQEKASPAKAGTETSSRKSNNKTPSNKKDNKNSTKELNNKTSAKNQDNKNSSRDSDKKTLAKKSNKTNPPSKKVDKNPPKKPDTKNSSKPKTITKPSTATENRIVCRCTICKMEFNSVDALSAHHKVEHAVISKFSCGFCDKKFFGATARNKHILEEHRKPLYARNCASSAQQLVTVLIPSINTAKSTSLENSNTDLSMKTSQTEAKDPPANEQGMPTEAVEALQSEAKKPPADTQGMTTEAQGSQALLQGNASTRLENGLAKITVAATSTSGPAVTTSKSALEIPPSKPALANFLQGKTYVMLPGSVKTSILQTSFPQVQLGSGVSLLKIPQAYVRETPGGPPRIALPSKIKPKNTHLTGVDKIGTSQLQCEFSKNEIQVKEAEGAVIAPQLSFEKR